MARLRHKKLEYWALTSVVWH